MRRPRSAAGWLLSLGLVAAGASMVAGVASRARGEAPAAPAGAPPAKPLPATPGDEVDAVRPALAAEIFPCTQCHNTPDFDDGKRELGDPHDKIKLAHDSERMWCLDCHDGGSRDQLKLPSGEKIAFKDSGQLCGRCHGTQHRDWRAGVHGRRTGQWDGRKKYLGCTSCHDPHAPHFAPLKPEPPPKRPEMIK